MLSQHMTPAHQIFLSVGNPDTSAQEQFISAIEDYLRSHNCEPQTVGRSKYSGRQPVQAARDTIGDCAGAVVVAFERTRILQGVDRPEGARPTQIVDESHPTIWNHMEASMAYANNLPILTVVQRGVKRQGMLSSRLEWVAIEGDLDTGLLRTEMFRQVFAEWLSLVQAGNSKKAADAKGEETGLDFGKLSVGFFLSRISIAQLIAIVTGACALLSVVAVASFKAGQYFK
jgi:hypothetical protein